MGFERGDLGAKIVGLTGSIGSGKSHILDIFANLGAPTQSSDAVAHELIDGEAFSAIATQFPSAVVGGKIDRQLLGKEVFADVAKKKLLEAILHPLVRKRNIEFAKTASSKFVVIEIPLLFESAAESYCDHVIAINVSRETIRERVMQRANMSEEKFEQIIALQMPTQEKLALAEFIIDNEPEDDTVGQVQKIFAELNKRIK